MSGQAMFRCVIMRGGTSKAVFLRKNDIPADPELRDRVILAIYGSPDVRQIDGLGGADPLTSKLAIISRSTRPDCDVDYLFGQVSLREHQIDYKINCGNISSAVGPYAIDEGLVPVQEPFTTVRIFNVNTGKRLIARVPVVDGKSAVDGDFRVDGVPGTGAKIDLDFGDVGGAATGRVLPTGRTTDILDIGGQRYTVSIVDAANIILFLRAHELGLKGTECRPKLAEREVLDGIERIRAECAQYLGFVSDWRKATLESPVKPFVIIVSPPADYPDDDSGELIPAGQIDVVSRNIYNQVLHLTHAATGAVCLGAACMIPGTVANEAVSGRARETGVVRIGHPRGIMQMEMAVDCSGSQPELKKAVFARTARRILEGYVYVRKSQVGL